MEKGIKYALSIFSIAYALKIIDVFILGSDPHSMFMAKIISLAVLLFIVFNVEEEQAAYIGLTTRNFGKYILIGIILFGIVSGCTYLPGFFLKMVTTCGYELQFSLDVLTFSVVTFFIIDSISDEAIFRGYIQKKFMQYGFWKAILLQAFLYGLYHLMWIFYVFWDFTTGTWITTANPSTIVLFAFYFVTYPFYVGVLTGYTFARTQSLVPVIICQTCNNTFGLFIIAYCNIIHLEIVVLPIMFLVGLSVLMLLLGGDKTAEAP